VLRADDSGDSAAGLLEKGFIPHNCAELLWPVIAGDFAREREQPLSVSPCEDDAPSAPLGLWACLHSLTRPYAGTGNRKQRKENVQGATEGKLKEGFSKRTFSTVSPLGLNFCAILHTF
jgi:hypothetical protein